VQRRRTPRPNHRWPVPVSRRPRVGDGNWQSISPLLDHAGSASRRIIRGCCTGRSGEDGGSRIHDIRAHLSAGPEGRPGSARNVTRRACHWPRCVQLAGGHSVFRPGHIHGQENGAGVLMLKEEVIRSRGRPSYRISISLRVSMATPPSPLRLLAMGSSESRRSEWEGRTAGHPMFPILEGTSIGGWYLPRFRNRIEAHLPGTFAYIPG